MDTIPPTVTVSSTLGSPTNTAPIPIRAVFSESVNRFDVDDVSVSNGTPSNFFAVSSSEYTFDVSPIVDGTTTVDIEDEAAYDMAGNGNIAAIQFRITYDGTAPSAPQNLMEEAGDGQVILIWAKNTESDFLRYRIYGGSTANPATGIDSTESAFDTTRTISGLNNGTTYYFRIAAVDTALNESDFSNEVSATPAALAVDESSAIPTSFALHPAHPNPLNPNTTIRFDLPETVDISIVVYDLMGREVARLVDRDMTAGYHQVIWDGRTVHGREVPTGIYIARLVTPEFTKSIKMLLLK